VQRLTKQVLELPRLLGLVARDSRDVVAHPPVIHAPQDLGHGGLAHAERARDVVLAAAFRGELHDLLLALANAQPRFASALSAATAGPPGAHRALRAAVGRPRAVARRPVNASHRVIVACTYRGSMSIAKQVRPVFSAAISAVPLPANGS
jgi:hypothetical protein